MRSEGSVEVQETALRAYRVAVLSNGDYVRARRQALFCGEHNPLLSDDRPY